MATAAAYTPCQISAVTGLPLPSVHKAIEHKLIRPKRVRTGGTVQRLFSRPQAVYLLLEARGLRLLPLNIRRRIARTVEQDPKIDTVKISDGSVIRIEVKSAGKVVDAGLRRLAEAERMGVSDAQIMRGTPVYKGTRIPVHAIAEMMSQGATVHEILEGYPALTRRKVELAPLYAKAFPRRGRPSASAWLEHPPRQVTTHRITA